MSKTFSKEEHYFKVNRKILEIASVTDLKKSELLIYLHHCRAINPKGKTLNCSVVGVNALSQNLKLDKKIIETATKSLIEKHFIKERPDVKTGMYKTTAIEVLPYPKYTPPIKNKAKGSFSPYKKKKMENSFIQIPSVLIDQGIISSKLERQVIFTILYLYSSIDWQLYWGVDYNLVRLDTGKSKGFIKEKTFGQGFHPAIYKKNCYKVLIEDFNIVIKSDNKFLQGNLKYSIDFLINEDIFKYIPVLMEKDIDEPDIIRKQREIFKGLVSFKNDEENKFSYRFSEDNIDNKMVYGILQPDDCFCVKNPSYDAYHEIRLESLKKQHNIYSKDYFRTRVDEHIKLVNTSDFWGWLELNYEDVYLKLQQITNCDDFQEMYEVKQKMFREEYVIEIILPEIKPNVIEHYNNYLEKLNS